MRLPDWEQRLHDYLAAARAMPHVYGQHDCLLHPAKAIKAVTGKDRARGHRGKYKSPATAVRYLKSLGFATPAAMLDSLFSEKPIGFAQRGDIVLTPSNGDWDIPGVCIGDSALVVGERDGREGLFPVPRALWLKAWSVE